MPRYGALISTGPKYHKFNLWITNAENDEKSPLVRLIETRYASVGVVIFISRNCKKYINIPEIKLTDISQLSAFPSG